MLVEIKGLVQGLLINEDESLQQIAKTARILLLRQSPSKPGMSVAPTAAFLERFQSALKDLRHELLPVRAHGMFVLRQMILEKNEIIKEHLDSVIGIFLDCIEDEDSFIYLNAIKGVTALTDVFPDQTIAQFVLRYMNQGLALDYRLRIGEALQQTIQRWGEAFPKHADIILPGVMNVLNDTLVEMRMSSLSLLSKIAEVDALSLIKVISQIVEYLLSLLQMEKQVETRRGIYHPVSAHPIFLCLIDLFT